MVHQYEAHRNGELDAIQTSSAPAVVEREMVPAEDNDRFESLVGDGDDISLSELGRESEESGDESFLSDISDDSDTESTIRSLRAEFWTVDSRLACQRVKRWQSQCTSAQATYKR